MEHAVHEGQSGAAMVSSSDSDTGVPSVGKPPNAPPQQRGHKKPTPIRLGNFIPASTITRLFRGMAARQTVLRHPDNPSVHVTIETDARGHVVGLQTLHG